MRHILLFAALIISFVTYDQLKTRAFQGQPVNAVSTQPQQTPKYDPNNPASWPDSLTVGDFGCVALAVFVLAFAGWSCRPAVEALSSVASCYELQF